MTSKKATARKYEYIYINLITFSYGHIAAAYGLYLCMTKAMWSTILFNIPIYMAAIIGVTAGAHRLWSHKAFKATMPLQFILIVFNTFAFQNSAIHWIRDHRLHHKYSDTDADPHNAQRGFFYSHVGWLLVKKHPDVREKGKTIDMSDIYSNPLLRFQKKYAILCFGTLCFALPTIIPIYFWGESLSCAWHLAILRYVANLNVTFLVNSAAHIWGYKPYDKSKLPAQNLTVALLSGGEGFHNYHHVFPWDYRTAELGNDILNPTTWFLDFFAKIGWAYDLKTVTQESINTRKLRTGDGKDLWGYDDNGIKEDLQDFNKYEDKNLWGWDDQDLTEKYVKITKILNTH